MFAFMGAWTRNYCVIDHHKDLDFNNVPNLTNSKKKVILEAKANSIRYTPITICYTDAKQLRNMNAIYKEVNDQSNLYFISGYG